ncbi:unnamed protein product [Euphydryas editha]|uniref:Ubiquitin-like protease family profile domain-containing protein n=1 Tax=Euphydryas editha TaxID=104508 RepID=A0AAU9TLV1_EUPED|nr:unnamed protein product [Euphydryas editha]
MNNGSHLRSNCLIGLQNLHKNQDDQLKHSKSQVTSANVEKQKNYGSSNSANISENACNTHVSIQCHLPYEVLFPTAMMKVQFVDGFFFCIPRALLNQGSQTSIITEDVAQVLKIPKKKYKGVISGAGVKESNEHMLNRWVDGQIIDAFASTFMKEWCDATYIPTDSSTMVLGRFSMAPITYKSSIHTCEQEIGKKLLIPYCFESHWRVLLVDIQLEECILLDPRSKSTDMKRVKKAFTTFIYNCSVTSSFRKLKDIDWTVSSGPKERPYQPENDIDNCGIYCMYYLRCVYEKTVFKKTFDPKKIREDIAHQLLSEADNVKERCLYCARIIEASIEIIVCRSC